MDNIYVVYRVDSRQPPPVNWQNPEAREQHDPTVPLTGLDLAQYTDKAEAIALCRQLRMRQAELTMLGVVFSAPYAFVVRGQKFNVTGGIKAWRVILSADDPDVEYEDEDEDERPALVDITKPDGS